MAASYQGTRGRKWVRFQLQSDWNPGAIWSDSKSDRITVRFRSKFGLRRRCRGPRPMCTMRAHVVRRNRRSRYHIRVSCLLGRLLAARKPDIVSAYRISVRLRPHRGWIAVEIWPHCDRHCRHCWRPQFGKIPTKIRLKSNRGPVEG